MYENNRLWITGVLVSSLIQRKQNTKNQFNIIKGEVIFISLKSSKKLNFIIKTNTEYNTVRAVYEIEKPEITTNVLLKSW